MDPAVVEGMWLNIYLQKFMKKIVIFYILSGLKEFKEFFHVDLIKEKVTVYVTLVANASLSLFFWILCKKCTDKFLHKCMP